MRITLLLELLYYWHLKIYWHVEFYFSIFYWHLKIYFSMGSRIFHVLFISIRAFGKFSFMVCISLEGSKVNVYCTLELQVIIVIGALL